MIELTLPYPPANLSPNARLHWAAKNRAAKMYKHDCVSLIRANKSARNVVAINPEIKIIFHPPDRRKRDKDNIIAAFKYGQDSLALALKCDDYIFSPRYEFGEPVKGGCVVIRLEVAA